MFCCLFFRIHQLGSGPADIFRIIVFHCSRFYPITITVFGHWIKKRRKIFYVHNSYQNLLRVYKILFFTYTLYYLFRMCHVDKLLVKKIIAKMSKVFWGPSVFLSLTYGLEGTVNSRVYRILCIHKYMGTSFH